MGYYYKLWELLFRRFGFDRVFIAACEEDKICVPSLPSSLVEAFEEVKLYYGWVDEKEVKLYCGEPHPDNVVVVDSSVLDKYEILNGYLYITASLWTEKYEFWLPVDEIPLEPQLYERMLAAFPYTREKLPKRGIDYWDKDERGVIWAKTHYKGNETIMIEALYYGAERNPVIRLFVRSQEGLRNLRT